MTDASSDRASLAAVLEHPERLRALHGTMLLDSPGEEAFDRLARLAARLLRTPLATVTLVDRDRQFYKACVGMPEPLATTRETPLDLSFCRHTVHVGAPLVIPDTRDDPRVASMASVTEFGVRAYAGVPLFADGHAIGTICVMDLRPRGFTDEEIAALGDLAASVTTEIELRAALRASAETAARLREATAVAEAARRAAEMADEGKSNLIAMMSHDLRTPLNAILGYAQVLESGAGGELTGEQRRYVQRIEVSQRHLGRMIEDLLTFARGYAGRVEFRPARLDSASTLATAAAMIEPLAQARGLEFRVDERVADAGAARGDPDRAVQVLVNLLTNAVKFTGRGGRVTLAARRGDGAVLWQVHDTGMGIAADRLDAVFEPFVQAGRSAHGDDGLGLGLAISRDLARGMRAIATLWDEYGRAAR